MSAFRPSANRFASKLLGLAAVCLAVLGLSAAPALASWHHYGSGHLVNPATPEQNAELAVCPGQVFSQPFLAFEDENFYTLVPGSEFNAGAEGWDLRRGAEVVAGARPDGSSGGVLQLPGGSVAISPPVCVTLQYPSARTWVQSLSGNGGLLVGVFYSGVKYGSGRVGHVGVLGTEAQGDWELSDPFEIKPELAGSSEGTREVRFVFANPGHGVFQVSGVFVDPRMR